MKARIKSTGVELEVHLVDKQARYIGSDGITYWEEDLDFGIPIAVKKKGWNIIELATEDNWGRYERGYRKTSLLRILCCFTTITL